MLIFYWIDWTCRNCFEFFSYRFSRKEMFQCCSWQHGEQIVWFCRHAMWYVWSFDFHGWVCDMDFEVIDCWYFCHLWISALCLFDSIKFFDHLPLCELWDESMWLVTFGCFNFYYFWECAESAVAGAAAGAVVEAVLYPIDTIKTRLQAGSVIQII